MIDLPIAAKDLTLVALRKYDRNEHIRGNAGNPRKFLCTAEQAEAAEHLPYFVRAINLSPSVLGGLLESGNLIGCIENFAFYRKQ